MSYDFDYSNVKFTGHRATYVTTERVSFPFITITRSLLMRNLSVKSTHSTIMILISFRDLLLSRYEIIIRHIYKYKPLVWILNEFRIHIFCCFTLSLILFTAEAAKYNVAQPRTDELHDQRILNDELEHFCRLETAQVKLVTYRVSAHVQT